MRPKKRKKRRIIRADIECISLVPKGATRIPALYKAEDKKVELQTLVKDDRFEELGELTAVVYAPEHVDAHGDIASRETIKQAAYHFMARKGGVNVMHKGEVLEPEDAYVAESFLIQKGDPRFEGLKDKDGDAVPTEGAWATVMKIDNKELRKAYRDGAWDGISMEGPAMVVAEKGDDEQNLDIESILQALRKELGVPPTQKDDIDMDAKELEAILTKNNETLVAGLGDVLKKALTPEEKPPGKKDEGKPDELKFEGDPLDPKAVEKHRQKVVARKALEDVDWNDAESVAAYQKTITKKSEGDESLTINPTDSEEVAGLKTRLAKALGKSPVPASGGNENGTLHPDLVKLFKTHLKKEDEGKLQPEGHDQFDDDIFVSKDELTSSALGVAIANEFNGRL